MFIIFFFCSDHRLTSTTTKCHKASEKMLASCISSSMNDPLSRPPVFSVLSHCDSKSAETKALISLLGVLTSVSSAGGLRKATTTEVAPKVSAGASVCWPEWSLLCFFVIQMSWIICVGVFFTDQYLKMICIGVAWRPIINWILCHWMDW